MRAARPIVVGVALVALAATVVDARTNLIGAWQQFDPIVRVAVLALEATYPFVVGLREAIPFARKQIANRRVAAAFLAPGAPELRANRPAWVFKIQAPGRIGTWLEAMEDALSMRHMARGRTVLSTYLRANDDVDAWIQMARVRAAESRGLAFLSSAMQEAILWHIVVDRLSAAGAPQEAKLLAMKKLEKMQDGPLYSSLFNGAKLDAVEIAGRKSGETYFSRYFQPLMVAFDERRFVESSGVGSEDERHALMKHLNHLAGGHVLAGWFTQGTAAPNGDMVRQALPKELRTGPQHRVINDQAKTFNKKKAARAVILMADADGVERAQAFEQAFQPGNRFRAGGLDCDYWTPYLEGGTPPHCFLWQSRRA